MLHNNNGHVPSSGKDPKLKRFLTASVKTKLPPIFSPTNWNNISKLGKQLTDDLASTYNYNTDSLEFYSADILSLYSYTLFLLLHKIQTWLDHDESLQTIKYYLGFDKETVDLMNIAMTELCSSKRNDKKRNNNNLESLFYYSCDIMRMQPNKDTVKEKFHYFLKMFEIPKEDILKDNEVELKKGLKSFLNEIVDNTITTSFRVSVDSMKMRILTDASNNEIVNSIKRRKVYSSENKSIQELVESYATESDGIRVNAYHVSILSFLIPDMFGYVYNHFELLYNLREHEIYENDKNNVENFSKFMSAFISTFVHRFFEFRGELSQELMNAMHSVEFFLDPSKTYINYRREFNNEGSSILNDPYLFQVYGMEKSIKNYYNKSERNDVIDNYMKVMMGDAVQKVLFTCTGEPLDHWKTSRFSKIVFQEENNNKDSLIKLLRKNNYNAFHILEIFSRIFSH